jgi:hypothetical protein
MEQKTELWIGLVHLKPFKKKAFDGMAGVYTNIITWAYDSISFLKKAETIAATMDLYVVDTEGEEPLSARFGDFIPNEELEDMRSRAEHNPNAIVYGTFHRYLHDDA